MASIEELEQEKLNYQKKTEELQLKINQKKASEDVNPMEVSLPEMLHFFAPLVTGQDYHDSDWKSYLPLQKKIYHFLKNKIPGAEEEFKNPHYEDRPDRIMGLMWRLNKTQIMKRYEDKPEQQLQVKKIFSVTSPFLYAIGDLIRLSPKLPYQNVGNSEERNVECAKRLLKTSGFFEKKSDKALLYQTVVAYMKTFPVDLRFDRGIVTAEIEKTERKLHNLYKKDMASVMKISDKSLERE